MPLVPCRGPGVGHNSVLVAEYTTSLAQYTASQQHSTHRNTRPHIHALGCTWDSHSLWKPGVHQFHTNCWHAHEVQSCTVPMTSHSAMRLPHREVLIAECSQAVPPGSAASLQHINLDGVQLPDFRASPVVPRPVLRKPCGGAGRGGVVGLGAVRRWKPIDES